MKKYLVICLVLTGCIDTDFQDSIPENLRIINIESIEFRVNGTYELQAEYTDNSGGTANVPITWTSFDPSILEINGNSATGIAEGMVTIKATALEQEDTFSVEVLDSRESIQISGFPEKIQTSRTFQFTVNYINVEGENMTISPTWTSSNTEIATVNSVGVVMGIKAGNVSIMASFGNVSDRVSVDIIDGSVSIDPKLCITTFVEFMTVGDNSSFVAGYFGTDGQVDESATISWSSSDTGVLTINDNGLASAIAVGVATITASSGGVRASVEVKVAVETTTTERTGILQRNGYAISGSFRLFINSEDELILSVTDYQTGGPSPYFYLAHQSTSVINGLKVSEAKSSGDFTYTISDLDASTELYTYDYLVVWCEPASITLGSGQFGN